MSPLFPWLTLVAVIWLQAMSATNTDFPAYSSALKSRLGITQVQLNNLAVASDAGKLFGWLSGIAAAYLPLWTVLTVGSAIGLVGYGVQFLFLTGEMAALSYWQYLFLQVLAGHSICWVNTACYVASMRKFPNDHGVVIGLATSYTGLSAKIYIAMAQVILGKNFNCKSVYLLLNAVVPMALALLTAPLLVESKPAMKGNGRGLFSVFVIAGVTGAYAVAETLVPVMGSSIVPPLMLLVMVGVLAGVPLLRSVEIARSRERVTVIVEDLEVSVSEFPEVMEVGGTAEKEVKEVGSEYGILKLVTSVEFWLYFLVYLCGGTTGLVYANNLGQVAGSRGVSEAVLLSISSTFGFFGKLSAAPLSLFTRYVVTLFACTYSFFHINARSLVNNKYYQNILHAECEIVLRVLRMS